MFPGFEPNADQRVIAATFRGLYVAFMNEGFSEEQAFTLVVETVRTAAIQSAGGQYGNG